MTELSTRKSFIVRVYQYDPEEGGKVAGLIELLDGSGANEPFTNSAELGAIVNRLTAGRKKKLKEKNR